MCNWESRDSPSQSNVGKSNMMTNLKLANKAKDPSHVTSCCLMYWDFWCPLPPQTLLTHWSRWQYSSLQGHKGFHWRRKWQPTPVFLPGKSHGQRSLAGYSPWGYKKLDVNEHTHWSTNLGTALYSSGIFYFDSIISIVWNYLILFCRLMAKCLGSSPHSTS